MTSRDFAFWLQGFFEITGDVESLSPDQIVMIKRHLDMVFHHEITPSYKDYKELKDVHDGKKTPPPCSDKQRPIVRPAPTPDPNQGGGGGRWWDAMNPMTGVSIAANTETICIC